MIQRIHNECRSHAPKHLRNNVAQHLALGEAAQQPHRDRHRGIQVRTRDPAGRPAPQSDTGRPRNPALQIVAWISPSSPTKRAGHAVLCIVQTHLTLDARAEQDHHKRAPEFTGLVHTTYANSSLYAWRTRCQRCSAEAMVDNVPSGPCAPRATTAAGGQSGDNTAPGTSTAA